MLEGLHQEKYLSSNFASYQVIRHKLTNATIQNVDLIVREQNYTHFFISFIKTSDILYKKPNHMFINSFSLCPTNLMRMRLFNNAFNPPILYDNFFINNLHLSNYDQTFRDYSDYLVQNRFIASEDKHKFFMSHNKSVKNAVISEDYVRLEKMFIFPVSLLNLLPILNKYSNREFISHGSISKAILQLNLEFNAPPADNLYLQIVYCRTFEAKFSGKITDQNVEFIPKMLFK